MYCVYVLATQLQDISTWYISLINIYTIYSYVSLPAYLSDCLLQELSLLGPLQNLALDVLLAVEGDVQLRGGDLVVAELLREVGI